MMRTLPEADWKYMRALKPSLLELLCERINTTMTQVLNDNEQPSQHERYLRAYKYLHDADDIVADCFLTIGGGLHC